MVGRVVFFRAPGGLTGGVKGIAGRMRTGEGCPAAPILLGNAERGACRAEGCVAGSTTLPWAGLGWLLSCSPPGSLRARPPDKAFSRAIYTGGELLLEHSCTRHRKQRTGRWPAQPRVAGCVGVRVEEITRITVAQQTRPGQPSGSLTPPGCSLPFSQCCRGKDAMGPCENHNLPAVR